MATTIFYYTGTGNSLWVAKKLADRLGGTTLVSMSDGGEISKALESDTIGLVFPVYIWGVPAPVIRFIDKIKRAKADYIFAIAVNAGQVSNTLVQLKGLLKEKGLKLSSGFEAVMPSNYIPWGGPGPEDEQQKRFDDALDKIVAIAPIIKEKKGRPVEKGPLWQRIVFTAINRLSFPYVPELDKKFWADEKCNKCGICLKVCPAHNIELIDGRPAWKNKCEQCFSCLQWCPEQALQYGKSTYKYKRYHQNEISLKDIISARK